MKNSMKKITLMQVEEALAERSARITRLIEKPRCMTPAAAATVVDAAMFGIGCIEGKVRAVVQAELDKRPPVR